MIKPGYYVFPSRSIFFKYQIAFWDGKEYTFLNQFFDFYFFANRYCKRLNKLFEDRYK